MSFDPIDLKTITRRILFRAEKMASPRPKSPRTPISKNEGESFWGKIGTIGRKKRIKEGKRSKFKFLPINDWLFRVDV